MRHPLAGTFFLSLLLFAAPLARADAPIVVGPIEDQGVIEMYDCGDFQVLDEYSTSFIVRRMRDRDGTVIRLVEQVWGVDTFVNSVNGNSIAAPYHNNTFVDFTTGLADIAGIVFKAIVPGVGPVFIDIGRVTVDRPGNLYFSAGPRQFFDGDFEALCAALR